MSETRNSKLADWLNPHVVVPALSMIVAVVLAYGALRSDVRNLETLVNVGMQQQQQAQAEVTARVTTIERQRDELIELKADVKYIKQKIDKLP